MTQSTTDPSKYTKAEDAANPVQTWGSKTSDALSKRYTAVANDEKQSAKKREAAMLFAVAEGHINDHEDFDAALQAASQALEIFKDLGDIEGVADSLRVVVDAMRLQSGKKDEKPEEALRLASEELVWFREQGHKRGQASMLLALARVNSSGRRGTKDRDQGIRQAKEAVKIYRELEDKAMEGAVLLTLVDLHCYVKSFQEAIGSANKALAIFEDLGDSRSEARAMHLLAEARFGNRQMEGGSQAAEEAIALWQELGMKRQEAIEHLTVAQWHVEEELGAPALEAAQKALVLLEELNDKSRIIAATKYAIRSHILLKQHEEALQAASNAADHWRRTGDMENLLEMLEVQIQALLDLEAPDEALPLAQEAVKVGRRTKKKKLEGQALSTLAQVQQAREEHVEALSASKEAIVIFRELGDQVAEATARHAAVSAYMGRKKLGEALDEAKKARAIFRKHGLRHDEGRALLVKSCAHKMAQELGEAVQDATEAQYLFQKERDRRWEAKALHDVAELQAMRENFPAAMRAAKKAEQLVQETTDKSNIAAVLSTVAQIHLSNMVAEISKAPREEPDFGMIEETVQAGWRARDAAHAVYEEEKSERTKALLAPIAYLLAQTFLAVKDADEALVHVQEGEEICNEGQDETGQIIGFILRSYVAILKHDMVTAKKEAENANTKSKDIGYDFGTTLCEGIFDLVESSKDADGGIPSAPPSTMMPNMPDMPMGMPNMPKPRGPMPRPGGGMAPMAPGGAPSAAAPAAPGGKVKIEPEMVKVQIQDVATSLVGDDSIAADTPLMDAGLDSLSMVEFRNELLKEFPGISLPGALLFDYPTVNTLRDFIYQTLMDG